MGRPLNKKYFGNRNIGVASTSADDKIGGEGVASYGTIVAGSGWTTNPDAFFSSPSLPGGVSVQGIVHYKALSFATTANGTGYAVGDVLEVNTGTAATKARAPVASILVVNTPVIANGGSNYDSGNGTNGDEVTFTHSNLSTGLTVRITSDSTGTATGISVVTAGIWTGSGAPPTTMANGVNGFTATLTHQFTDGNGTGLQLSGIQWGVYAFGAVSVAGDYTAFPDLATSLGAVTGTGMNAHANITMGLLSVAVTQKGSGYISSADAELLFDDSNNGASATAVLTTDSGTTGSQGNANNQENAILAYAWISGQRLLVDIIKQEASRRYKVDARGYESEPVFGRLVPYAANDNWTAKNVEMDITAFDSNNNEYWVTKLTAHKALLTRKISGNGEFATGANVKWTFNDAVEGESVKIDNA